MARARAAACRIVWRVPSTAELQRMADDQVIALLGSRHANRQRYVDAVCAELGRRERAARREPARARRQAAARARAASERTDYRLYVHGQWLRAEADCRGVLLCKAGVAAGIDPITLFSGPQARARKWASEELLEWWDVPGNGRLTFAVWKAGQREPEPDLTDPRNLVKVA